MIKLQGKSVYDGIAIGKIALFGNADTTVKQYRVENIAQEKQRVESAIERAKEQLGMLYEKAMAEVGEESAAIFEVHQMMLEDADYQDSIFDMIANDAVNAEYAVEQTSNNFSEIFSSMDDEYMRARAADIKDISSRIMRILSGVKEIDCAAMEPSIIVAEDLSPSETMQMDKSKILAFITVQGSTTSHTAILARMMNIPALIGVPVNLEEIQDGTLAIVDGESSEFIISPDAKQLEIANKRVEEERLKKEVLSKLIGQETVTKSGRKMNLYANIGSVSDMGYVLEHDAGGIGLFRSEFLYLGRTDFPSEEEQFEAYRQVLEMMGDKKVIVRTLDIGADKQVDYFNLDKEENPALGYRAIRICLTQTDIFKVQLRALLRASMYGNLSIMYPMITSVWELERIQEIMDEVKQELDGKNIAYRSPEQGIMVETPAAVMISDDLADHVDFFSIGTNDLTQYTLALDRQNNKLDAFYNPHHKAILKMIAYVVKEAHAKGKWVGICGELAADLALTEEFVAMGIDELSVTPSMVLRVRDKIRSMD